MSAPHRDDEGAKIGMWLFLFTEIMLFGGLFMLYSAYRFQHPLEFHEASQELNAFIGVLNTVVLLTSSWTLAMSLTALAKGDTARARKLILATLALGALFLFDKGIEWSGEFRRGIYPDSPELLRRSPGEILFIGLYFTMTGLHGVHVIIGLLVLSAALWRLRTGGLDRDNPVFLENAGLYWHLVDVIWIFLLPLFYLAA